MKPFERLKAWEAAHRLFVQVYESSESWPPRERYGLTAQIRRSALSVGSNLAEGVVRRTPADFARFIEIALGSLSELSYQLMAAKDVRVVPVAEYEQLDAQRETVSKLTWSLYAAVRRRIRACKATEDRQPDSDRPTDRWTDGPTDRQTDRPTSADTPGR